MPALYYAANGAMPTTAALTPITTGTAIKTLLQIATPSTCAIQVVSWGVSFDGSAAATPIRCELVDTNVAATVTAHVAAGVQPYNAQAGAVASLMTLGTSATGYTATAEGSITATRYGDLQLIPPTTSYSYTWPLGNEFQVGVSRFLRIRVTATAAVLAYAWICWQE